jgi:hypothetical protein
MTVHWESLFAVVAVALGATLAVVALVTTAMVGLSARSTALHLVTRRRALSSATGTAVAGVCLAAAAVIVVIGLWAIVMR